MGKKIETNKSCGRASPPARIGRSRAAGRRGPALSTPAIASSAVESRFLASGSRGRRLSSNARGRGGFFPQTGRMAGSAETPRRASGGGKNLMPCNPLSLCAGIVRIREKGTENLRVPARRFGRPVVKCSPRSLGGNLSGHRPTPSLLQGANRPRRPAEGACSGCPPRHIAGRFSDAKGKNVSDSV